MSNVHYFPRYSQKENMITNNTLLLLSRLYKNSSDKFDSFLTNLCEEEDIQITTGMSFKQQERTGNAVPDGKIYQESFKLIAETKLYGQENIEQIKRHLQAFDNEDTSIFLFIDKEDISASFKKRIREEIDVFNKEKEKGIKFIATTFKKICSKFDGTLDDYDFEMKNLINDYREFCYESELINNFETKIRVVLCGKTFEQNLRTKIYYAPSNRSYKPAKFLGLYKNKCIRAIGEVKNIVDVTSVNGEISLIEPHLGKYNKEMKEILIGVIDEAKEKFQYDLSNNHRFFFVNEFLETDYTKISKGGLMGTRYFDVSEIEGYIPGISNEEIANMLREHEWR